MAGQLIQRGERTWLVRIYAGTVGGKRKYLNYTVHGTKRDAQARLNKLLVDRDSDRLVMPSRLTLAEFVEQWMSGDAVVWRLADTHFPALS